MGMTCIQLCQAALYEKGITPPASIESASSMTEIQLRNCLYAVHRYLRRMRTWPQQKRTYTFHTIAGRSQYNLPDDFYAMCGDTQFDQTRGMRVGSSISDTLTNQILHEYELSGSPYGFRVFGPDFNRGFQSTGGQFQVVPTPETSGIQISFDYITGTIFLPPVWQAGTAYSTAGEKINVNGQILIFSAAGTTGTVAPYYWWVDGANTANIGCARDNTVTWAHVPDYATATQYEVGMYVNANSNIYICSVGGVGTGAPSHSSGTATDNTITWTFVATPSAWAAGTAYTADSSYVTSNSKYFRCIASGISGLTANSPNFTNAVFGEKGSTNAPRWTWQATSQETIPTTGGDEYLSIFDDDVVITGIQYKYQDAKGLNWETAFKEYLDSIDPSKTRWHGAYVGSMRGGGGNGPRYSVPYRSWEGLEDGS